MRKLEFTKIASRCLLNCTIYSTISLFLIAPFNFAQADSNSSGSSSEESSSSASSSESSSSDDTESSSDSSSDSSDSSSDSSSSESSSSEASSSSSYDCCVFRIQEPNDTSCAALDQEQCESASTSGTEGSPFTYVCYWEDGECKNTFENMCEDLENEISCDYSETVYVSAEDLNEPVVELPETCYAPGASIHEEYCGHGTEEMCEDYVSLISGLAPPTPGSGICVEIGSNACLVFSNPEAALSSAQSICSTAQSLFGAGYEINISGNQCSGVMTMTGEPLPEFATPLSICISNNNVEITYPVCIEECTGAQEGESYSCLETESDTIPKRMTCCPVFGGMMMTFDKDGKIIHIPILTGYAFKDGETCEDEEEESSSSSSEESSESSSSSEESSQSSSSSEESSQSSSSSEESSQSSSSSEESSQSSSSSEESSQSSSSSEESSESSSSSEDTIYFSAP
jgi:hypothetical protein